MKKILTGIALVCLMLSIALSGCFLTPNYELSINKDVVKLGISQSVELVVEVSKNGEATDEVVTWSVDNAEIAELGTANGNTVQVTAKSAGSAVVTATISDKTISCTVTVASGAVGNPEITNLTSTSVEWGAVTGVAGYKVSVDGGVSFIDVDATKTSFDLAQGVNPFDIKIQAIGDDTHLDSQVVGINVNDVTYVGETKLSLATVITVSGAVNTASVSYSLPALEIDVNGNKLNVDAKFVEWTVDKSSVVSVEEGIITAKGVGKAKVSGAGKEIEVNVGTAISSKADLDYLGFAAQNSQAELWDADKSYVLTQDIDYASETYHEQYIVPIAATPEGRAYCTYDWGWKWGIYGNLNPGGALFRATMDGNGHSIKNAIIPYGVLVGNFGGPVANIGSNFIGYLYGGGVLKNVAFENLHFETPKEATGTYMYSAENEKLDTFLIDETEGRWLVENCYSSSDLCNFGMNIGVVGYANSMTIENVYVDTVMSSRCYADFENAACGVLVGLAIGGETNTIKNCVVRTAYDNQYNVNCGLGTGGMGALVGKNTTDNYTNMQDCFVLTYEATGLTKVSSSAPVTNESMQEAIYSIGRKLDDNFTNCKVYDDLTSMTTEQEGKIADFILDILNSQE